MSVDLLSVRNGKLDIPDYEETKLEIYRYIDSNGIAKMCNKIIIKNTQQYYPIYILTVPQLDLYIDEYLRQTKWKISPGESLDIYLSDNIKTLYLINVNIGIISSIEFSMYYDNDIRNVAGININRISDIEINKPSSYIDGETRTINTINYSYTHTLYYNTRQIIVSSSNTGSSNNMFLAIGYGANIYSSCDKPIIINNLYIPAGTEIYVGSSLLHNVLNLCYFSNYNDLN